MKQQFHKEKKEFLNARLISGFYWSIVTQILKRQNLEFECFRYYFIINKNFMKYIVSWLWKMFEQADF